MTLSCSCELQVLCVLLMASAVSACGTLSIEENQSYMYVIRGLMVQLAEK